MSLYISSMFNMVNVLLKIVSRNDNDNKMLHRSTNVLLPGSIDVIATPSFNADSKQLFLTQAGVVNMDIQGLRHGQDISRLCRNW